MVGRKDFIPRLVLNLFVTFKKMLVAVIILNNSSKQLCHLLEQKQFGFSEQLMLQEG